MTTASYSLGKPPAAGLSGGICRARDLNQGRNVHGRHRFAATTHCQLNNGLVRITVGAAGSAPTLTVAFRRGEVTVDDVFEDTFHNVFGGGLTSPEWLNMGVITIDSPTVSALLTGVRLVDISDESVTLQLVVPATGDAWITLERGERQFHVQHGDTRPPFFDIDRRIRLTDAPSPVGVAHLQRVQEDFAVMNGTYRFIGALDPATVNAGAFSLTAMSTTSARFGAGVGTAEVADTPGALHAQLTDASLAWQVAQ